MMAVFAVKAGHVQVHHTVHGKGQEEFSGHFRFKGADPLHRDFHIVHEIGPSGKVQHNAGQCLIHGAEEGAVAADALLISQRFEEHGAQGNAQVFNGVMVVHFQVPLAGEGNIHAAVTGKEVHHVVEETDTRGSLKAPFSIDDKGNGNVCLPCFSMNLCLSHESSFRNTSRRASSTSLVVTVMR